MNSIPSTDCGRTECDRPSLSAANATLSPSGLVSYFEPPTLPNEELSEKELFVFDRLIEGRTIPEIGAAMNVRNAVVMDLRWEILQKCGCMNLVEMMTKLLHIERDKSNRLSVTIVGEVV